MTILAPNEAYRRWAPTYQTENVVTTLDCAIVGQLSPSTKGKRLLDVGCGTGRRLLGTGARLATGVEPCEEMLAAGRATHVFGPEVDLLPGDARDLPVESAVFDLAWCRLMMGHVRDCRAVYRELARAVIPGATVVVTDFHPEAAARGLKRTFPWEGEYIEVEHHVHPIELQIEAAADCGLVLCDASDGKIGPEVRRFYAEAGRLTRYEQQLGMRMVSGLAFRRDC